jgi:hypothetical protein
VEIKVVACTSYPWVVEGSSGFQKCAHASGTSSMTGHSTGRQRLSVGIVKHLS